MFYLSHVQENPKTKKKKKKSIQWDLYYSIINEAQCFCKNQIAKKDVMLKEKEQKRTLRMLLTMYNGTRSYPALIGAPGGMGQTPSMSVLVV